MEVLLLPHRQKVPGQIDGRMLLNSQGPGHPVYWFSSPLCGVWGGGGPLYSKPFSTVNLQHQPHPTVSVKEVRHSKLKGLDHASGRCLRLDA